MASFGLKKLLPVVSSFLYGTVDSKLPKEFKWFFILLIFGTIIALGVLIKKL